MGKLSYKWGEQELRDAEKSESSMHDAAMISLSFVRILELELNEKLLLPMLRDATKVREIEDAWRRSYQFLKAEDLRISNNRKKKRDKAMEGWSKLIPQLMDVVTGKKPGLELGYVHWLL